MKYRGASLRGAIHTFLLRLADGSDSYPAGLALAANGDLVVANSLGHRVCQLSPRGEIERVAGTGMPGFEDGSGAVARFNNPKAVAVARDGTVFVADCDNHAIRSIAPGTRTVRTFVGRGQPGFEDGTGRNATLRSPRGLAFDAEGRLLVATMQSVRRVTPDGTVTTIARHGASGGGPSHAALGFLGGIATHPHYGILATDTTNHAVWRIDDRGTVQCLAGGTGAGWSDGAWEAAEFNKPRGIVVDDHGRILVADSKNDALRVLLPSGVTESIRGEDVGVADGFDYPTGLAIGPDGTIFIADQLNNRIYQVVL